MFNLFPHNTTNAHKAVSSLALGAGASAAFYAATAICFFLKDCHEKTLAEAIVLLTPHCRSQAASGLDLFTRGLGLYTSYIAPPHGGQFRESDTKGENQLGLQDIPQDDQTPNMPIHTFQKVTLWLEVGAGSTWGGLCHVPVFRRRHRVVHMQFAASCAHSRWTWGFRIPGWSNWSTFNQPLAILALPTSELSLCPPARLASWNPRSPPARALQVLIPSSQSAAAQFPVEECPRGSLTAVGYSRHQSTEPRNSLLLQQ